MTRIFVQRGPGASSSSTNRPSPSLVPPSSAPQVPSNSKSDEEGKEVLDEHAVIEDLMEQWETGNDDVGAASHGVQSDSLPTEHLDKGKSSEDNILDSAAVIHEIAGIQFDEEGSLSSGIGPSHIPIGGSCPPPPPVPPPKPYIENPSPRRIGLGPSNAVRIGTSRRPLGWSVISRSPSDSRPSSPRSYGEGEGYNSADEQGHCYASYYDAERERLFEMELRRVKGFEVKRMLDDGNCLFRAVADQVYGDPEAYDLTRQMCIDYMEGERDHFSQFITEGFASYCRRKRRDKVYGNNVEIQAFAEMYNRLIHIYSYSTEPINIFQGNYMTGTPPIRLSYHHGNHYNSLVDPRHMTVGAGLGFSSLRGRNIDKDQVKAAIKAQQDQHIDNALLAEGRFYSDMELTEKEIERMVMEASRAEYLAEEKLKQHPSFRESSTSSRAEPSSSVARSSRFIPESDNQKALSPETVLTSSIQMVLAMGFSYMQAVEAYSIFGDDVDSMICYLVEMGGNGGTPGGSYQRKGKAAE